MEGAGPFVRSTGILLSDAVTSIGSRFEDVWDGICVRRNVPLGLFISPTFGRVVNRFRYISRQEQIWNE